MINQVIGIILLNLKPIGGELNTGQKIAKLTRGITKLAKAADKVDGADKAAKLLLQHYAAFYDAIKKGNKEKVASAFGNFTGQLFELRLAASVKGVLETGRDFVWKGVNSDVYLVIERGGKLIFGEAKYKNMKKWTYNKYKGKFMDQMKRLKEYAADQGATVEYYFRKGLVSDDIVNGLKKDGYNVILVE